MQRSIIMSGIGGQGIVLGSNLLGIGATALGRYLKAGGLLLADACCGRLGFDAAFRREIAKALPDQKLERLPADHPLYHVHVTETPGRKLFVHVHQIVQ